MEKTRDAIECLAILSLLLFSSFLLPPTMSPTSAQRVAGSSSVVPQVNYVVVIMMENHPLNTSSCCGGANGILGNIAAPYITQLARDYGLAGNYSAVTPGSLGDYLSIVGGSSFSNMPCVGNESPPTTCSTTAPNLIDRIEASGRTWKAYMEDYTGGCHGTNVGAYDYWHNPFLYFVDIQNSTARCSKIVSANPGHSALPDNQFISDLNSTTTASNFMWLTPNEVNNMHGYNSQPPSISAGNNYLSQLIPLILKTSIFATQSAALLLVWDEPTTCSVPQVPVTTCPIPAIWLGPAAKRSYVSISRYNHYSALATIETLWNLPPLTTNDSNATPMLEFFTSSFQLSLSNSGDISVVQGGSAYATITLRQLTGMPQSNASIGMSCAIVPSNTSCLFSPAFFSCTSTCLSALKITTRSNTPTASSYVTITASSGPVTNSTSFAINVLPPLQQRGDVNGDCNTNIFDLAMVSGNFGKRVTTDINPRSDLNLDGEINVIDLAMVATNIGRTCF